MDRNNKMKAPKVLMPSTDWQI